MHTSLTTLGVNCSSLQILGNYVHKTEKMMLKVLRLKNVRRKNMKSLTDCMIAIATDELAEKGLFRDLCSWVHIIHGRFM